MARRSTVIRNQSFSLVELMVVIAIVAILAAVATPVYKDFVVRSEIANSFSLVESIINKQKEYFAINQEFGAVADLGLPVGGAYYAVGNPTDYGKIVGITVNGAASGTADFLCSDGTPFGEVGVLLDSSTLGISSTLMYEILLREVDGVVVTKCFYRTDHGTTAALAERYFPSFCDTPSVNPGGTNCFLPW